MFVFLIHEKFISGKCIALNSKLSDSDKIRYEEIIGVYLRYTPIIPSYRILSESDNLEFHAVCAEGICNSFNLDPRASCVK